jgi:hypothetical protein
MEENLFNFILTMFFGFMIIYHNYPVPKIIYKKNHLSICSKDNKELCIEE